MHTYKSALEIIATAVTPMPEETVALADALNHRTTHAVSSPIAVPPFDNSAMDGFAVHSIDTTHATASNPVRLKVSDTVLAGDSSKKIAAKPGTACEIMTGAPVPPDYDGVIPVEQVDVETDTMGNPVAILVNQVVERGRNLRRAGEDFQAEATLVDAGTLINASHIMGLAAAGTQELRVARRPRIAVITTGNELDTETSAGTLKPGMINDANGPYLAAAIQQMHLVQAGFHRCTDSPEELTKLINKLRDNCDIILTTGGVSAGRMDFVPSVLDQLDAKILFHKVSIRPGKPLLFAHFENGPLIFGLPGNPIAVACGLRFFVIPAILQMQALAQEDFSNAVLTHAMRKKPGMVFFAKGYAKISRDGKMAVTALPGQESFKIYPLMQANCWIVTQADSAELEAGSIVSIAPLFPGYGF